MFDTGPVMTCCQRGLKSQEGQVLPVRCINSVAKDSALWVKGSVVESVRIPNVIVNMLLQVMYHICQTLMSILRQKRIVRTSTHSDQQSAPG